MPKMLIIKLIDPAFFDIKSPGIINLKLGIFNGDVTADAKKFLSSFILLKKNCRSFFFTSNGSIFEAIFFNLKCFFQIFTDLGLFNGYPIILHWYIKQLSY